MLPQPIVLDHRLHRTGRLRIFEKRPAAIRMRPRQYRERVLVFADDDDILKRAAGRVQQREPDFADIHPGASCKFEILGEPPDKTKPP